jgi:hypothetical protein
MAHAAVTEPLVFVLPLPVNIGNSRTHWAAKNKAKKDYWAICDFMLMAKRLPPRPARPFPRAQLAAAIHHTHDTDADNREARLKWAIDWLHTRGYIVDDGDAYLERQTICGAVRCRLVSERRLVLTLTPLEIAA